MINRPCFRKNVPEQNQVPDAGRYILLHQVPFTILAQKQKPFVGAYARAGAIQFSVKKNQYHLQILQNRLRYRQHVLGEFHSRGPRQKGLRCHPSVLWQNRGAV